MFRRNPKANTHPTRAEITSTSEQTTAADTRNGLGATALQRTGIFGERADPDRNNYYHREFSGRLRDLRSVQEAFLRTQHDSGVRDPQELSKAVANAMNSGQLPRIVRHMDEKSVASLSFLNGMVSPEAISAQAEIEILGGSEYFYSNIALGGQDTPEVRPGEPGYAAGSYYTDYTSHELITPNYRATTITDGTLAMFDAHFPVELRPDRPQP